jgi:hypothetical protein
VISKPYQDKFIHDAIDDINTAYELIVLPKIKGNIIVVITALEKNSEINVNNIIWIEQIINQERKKAFFQVDLIWHEDLRFFCSPQWNPCDEEIIYFIKTFCSEASYSKCVH